MKARTHWAILAMPLSLLGLPLANADPLSADTSTKEATYTSSFEGYIKDEDHEAGGWVAANERVGEIGGWRTYLRRAQEPVSNSKQSGDDRRQMPHGGHRSSDAPKQGDK